MPEKTLQERYSVVANHKQQRWEFWARNEATKRDWIAWNVYFSEADNEADAWIMAWERETQRIPAF